MNAQLDRELHNDQRQTTADWSEANGMRGIFLHSGAALFGRPPGRPELEAYDATKVN